MINYKNNVNPQILRKMIEIFKGYKQYGLNKMLSYRAALLFKILPFIFLG